MATRSDLVGRTVLLVARSSPPGADRLERLALCSAGEASRRALADAVGVAFHSAFRQAEHEFGEAAGVDLDALASMPLDVVATTFNGGPVDHETVGLLAVARQRVLRLRAMGYGLAGFVEVGR